MAENSKFKAYDVDDYITEIYDQTETQTEDVQLLRELVADRPQLKILEPFCGNGRILIPLAQDGHEVVGMDNSVPMLKSASQKLSTLPLEVQKRVSLIEADVTVDSWPTGFDLVILGGNCFYELATPEEQENCIRATQSALVPNGYLFLDNNHMEGELDPEWRDVDVLHRNRFPTGTCNDGTKVMGTTETVWVDVVKRLTRIRRSVEIMTPDGIIKRKEWTQQKHPPSTIEMQGWLDKHGFEILGIWGDRDKSQYTEQSDRAVFWAKRKN